MAEVPVTFKNSNEVSVLGDMTQEEFEELSYSVLEEYGGGCGPSVVDLEITGACPWRCEWCWGPEHNQTGDLSETEWRRTVGLFASMGTERVTITGGEPLLSKHLDAVVDEVIKQGMSVTLSTAGFGLTSEHALLDKLDKADDSVVGLPLDSHVVSSNSRMRPALNDSNKGWNFNAVLDSLQFIQKGYPNIGVTLRTVVSNKNWRDIGHIPSLLRGNGIDLSQVRWKLYQLNPNEGPRTDAMEDFTIRDEVFETVSSSLRDKYSDDFRHIDVQSVADSAGRYIFVDPSGSVRIPESSKEVVGEQLNFRSDPHLAADYISFLVSGLEFPKLLTTYPAHWAVDVANEMVENGELDGKDFQDTKIR